jgi:hypothetical protein
MIDGTIITVINFGSILEEGSFCVVDGIYQRRENLELPGHKDAMEENLSISTIRRIPYPLHLGRIRARGYSSTGTDKHISVD